MPAHVTTDFPPIMLRIVHYGSKLNSCWLNSLILGMNDFFALNLFFTSPKMSKWILGTPENNFDRKNIKSSKMRNLSKLS